jgi:hypothetical protein
MRLRVQEPQGIANLDFIEELAHKVAPVTPFAGDGQPEANRSVGNLNISQSERSGSADMLSHPKMASRPRRA